MAADGRVPPAGLSKDLLGRMIAARLQERAFGGLDRDSLRFLESLARHDRPPPIRQFKPGTVLVREYQGRRHTVTTVRDGFDWQGITYRSLSAIARAITGTAWSGPRFFALQAGGDDGIKRKRKSAAAVADVGSGRPTHGRDSPRAIAVASPAAETATPCMNPKPRNSTMRPYWKGYLKLALVSCPIALHAACLSAERIAFRQINKATGNRLRQQLIDEETPSRSTPSTKGAATRSPRGSI